MNQQQPGLYGDLLYRDGALVVVRSLLGSVTCDDWTADVTPHGHLMFLNAVVHPETWQIYASGKANIGSAVVIVGPDKFETVIPDGWPNYPSQLAVVEGRVVCYVVTSLTEFGMFDLSGRLLATLTIPPDYQATSEGIRFVADDGTVMWGKQTEAQIFEGLVIREWMQRSGYTGGQGQDGGFALSGNGVSTLYPSGNTFFPRIAVEGDTLALLYVNGATVCWDTLTLPLEAIPPAPAQKPPKIVVGGYDPLLKAGEPWQLGFSNAGDGTQFLVTKDAKDRLWIEAQNAAGSDHTGQVRPLTVEGPDAPEPPEPPMLGRFWYQPNVASRDLIEMFQRFDGFAQIDVFTLPVQCVLTDPSGTNGVGDNTYPNLVAANAFASLKAAQIAFVIEMGSIKEWDCTAEKNMAGMRTAVTRVRDAGGDVAAISTDEPLTANQRSDGCHLPMAACADAHAKFHRACRDEGVACGLLEAWPEVPLHPVANKPQIANVETFLQLLADRGALPDYWHPDIDWNRAKQSGLDPAKFIAEAQQLANRYGITFGVFVNSTVDPVQTEAAHYKDLQLLARRIHGIHPLAAHVHVAAWCRRGTNTGPQDIPDNLSAYGLVASLTDTRAVFDATPIDPPEEIDPMDYKLADYVLRLKAVKTSAAGGKVTAVLPDDQVASVQPDGTFQVRPAGTDAAFEQAYDRAGLLLYEPVPDKRYAVAYRLDA